MHDARPDRNTVYHGPVAERLSTVPATRVRWLWPGKVALGKLTLLAGDPGLGKSFVTLDLAARLSRGDAMPDGSGGSPTPASTLLLSAEDDAGDTLVPRLRALGADLGRVLAVHGTSFSTDPGRVIPFDLARDLSHLATLLVAEPGARLIVIDPISAYTGNTNNSRNAEVRAMLAPLSDLAARHGVAVLAVTHLNKGGGGDGANRGNSALYRAMDSLAFTAAARTVLMVVADPADRARRLLLPGKNNLGKDDCGMAYRIVEDPAGDATIAWEEEPVRLHVGDVLGAPAGSGGAAGGDAGACLDEAVVALQRLLRDGPRPIDDVKREMSALGVSDYAFRKARERLGVQYEVRRGATCGLWTLPVAYPDHSLFGEDGESPGSDGVIARIGH